MGDECPFPGIEHVQRTPADAFQEIGGFANLLKPDESGPRQQVHALGFAETRPIAGSGRSVFVMTATLLLKRKTYAAEAQHTNAIAKNVQDRFMDNVNLMSRYLRPVACSRAAGHEAMRIQSPQILGEVR